jgi:hypothetical protein
MFSLDKAIIKSKVIGTRLFASSCYLHFTCAGTRALVAMSDVIL